MRAVAVAVAIIASLAGAAAAEEPAAAPPEQPRWMWSIGLLLRWTTRDPGATQEIARLDEYGWNAQAPVLAGLRSDFAYLAAPWVDVGVAWGYARGTYAIGPQSQDMDRIEASTTELGVFSRLHWVRPDAPVAAEPRAELGLARTGVDLRDTTDSGLGTYLRVGLDLRAGTRQAGLLVSLDYTYAFADARLDLPTGGVGLGISFFARQWN